MLEIIKCIFHTSVFCEGVNFDPPPPPPKKGGGSWLHKYVDLTLAKYMK